MRTRHVAPCPAQDILTDAAVNPVPFLEGSAHEGFAAAADRLVEALKEVLPHEVAAHPGYRLVLCGRAWGLTLLLEHHQRALQSSAADRSQDIHSQRSMHPCLFQVEA